MKPTTIFPFLKKKKTEIKMKSNSRRKHTFSSKRLPQLLKETNTDDSVRYRPEIDLVNSDKDNSKMIEKDIPALNTAVIVAETTVEDGEQLIAGVDSLAMSESDSEQLSSRKTSMDDGEQFNNFLSNGVKHDYKTRSFNQQFTSHYSFSYFSSLH